ncbi:Serine/threonine-protein kinase prk-2 [Parelaphostrongylus tenuis]|uniref:non-specific serine/threonine protein kinase n=1 Tax=Parelaphostrongylus tenuis TaxID=148309 RepID=A0AAD5MW59_PARTN|nr:Serine/threonine-protein kinase prk-2 [Parelaphostrongylus tenuis]
MTLPVLARKVKKLASFQLFNLKLLLNGESSRGFNKFKKQYKLKGELGRGGFGIVYRAVRISDDLPVAVKFIDRRTVREWGKINDEQLPMEICMLARCSKIRGVIRLIDWYSIPEGYLIVMERPYPCVDMFDFIKGQQSLDEEMARFLFKQIVQTLHECHQKRVLHRDLKDENIIIDLVTGETKLIDFGAATVLKKSHYTDFQGTRLYCPPEWFLHSLYLGREAAVWSLGVLLYNALNGRLPFKNEKDVCTSHLLGPLPFYSPVSAEAKDLIAKCLAFDPFSRCSIEEILRHPWVTQPSFDWLAISAASEKTLHEHPRNEDERENSEELEEIVEEAEDSQKDDNDEDDTNSSEDESGVGSLASTSLAKTCQRDTLPTSAPRFSKTSLLAAPTTDDLKAVVNAAKTKSVYHGDSGRIRPSRRRPKAADSTILSALRRKINRERQIQCE